MNTNQYCNDRANQILILSTIYSSIIAQEIPDDDLLNILADLLQAIGSNLTLTADVRANCKANLKSPPDNNQNTCNNNVSENDSSTQLISDNIVANQFNRSTKSSKNTKKTRKKFKKRKKIKSCP